MDTQGFTKKFAIDVKAGFDPTKLKGKSVVVTGDDGLGEQITRDFVKAGAFVTIGDLADDRGQQMVSELGEDKVAFAQCNINVWTEQVGLFKTAVATSPTKGIDVVVANAGISGQDAVWKDDATDDEPIEPDLKIVQTNLIGTMYTVKLAVHYLARNKEGRDRCLLMTASLAGYFDQPGSPQYCASKWGVRGIMRSMRQTMPGTGMRVNIIAPWFIQTRILSKEVVDHLSSRGIDYAEKEDAAAAVLHLASDTTANGRACGILPRKVFPTGYIDLMKDDFDEDDLWTTMQAHVLKASHRIGTK